MIRDGNGKHFAAVNPIRKNVQSVEDAYHKKSLFIIGFLACSCVLAFGAAGIADYFSAQRLYETFRDGGIFSLVCIFYVWILIDTPLCACNKQ